MRFRLSTKPTWAELRVRVLDALATAFPATAFDVAAADAPPCLSWRDGPAEGSVAGVVGLVGDVPGWTVESSMLGPDPHGPRGVQVLRLVRSFSDAALALAVVRFHAAGVRPFERSRPGAVDTLWAILEEDDPATSGYPLTDRIRDLLMAAPEPAGMSWSDDPAERWAQKLVAVGYDRLWSQAWSTVEL
jgi:hypothetical protein